MAFTETQKVSIRGYLGVALGNYQYNTIFESMLDKVGANAVEQAAVEAILTELVAVDAVIAAAGVSAARGALKKVDEIEFYSPKESQITIVDGMKRGRMLIERLASRFGFTSADLPSHYFGSSGSRVTDITFC